jgi:hypothetical protein
VLPDPTDDDAVILYVADWLLFKQKKPSFAAMPIDASHPEWTQPVCSYRGGEAKDKKPCACGVGCLIPDDEYDPEFECMGIAVTEHIGSTNLVSAKLMEDGHYLPLLAKLQGVHDSALNMDEKLILPAWWAHFVKMTYSLSRDRMRSPCRDKTSNNQDSFKDTSFKILNWTIPGVTPDDIRRVAEECRRQR